MTPGPEALPRARVVIVDGRGYPAPSLVDRLLVVGSTALNVGGVGGPEVAFAQGPRRLCTSQYDLLVEDAPIGNEVMRLRGADALVVVPGRALPRFADALAAARVHGTPLVVIVRKSDEEERLVRRLLLVAGHDADDAIGTSLAELVATLDERLRPRHDEELLLTEALPDGRRMLVSGAAGYRGAAFVLGAEGAERSTVEVEAAVDVRAGGFVRSSAPASAAHVSTTAWPCLWGAFDVDWSGEPPPAHCGVLAFTGLGEVAGLVDGKGAVSLAAALPVSPTLRLGVMVTHAPMRPSSRGELGARILTGVVRRAPGVWLRTPIVDDDNDDNDDGAPAWVGGAAPGIARFSLSTLDRDVVAALALRTSGGGGRELVHLAVDPVRRRRGIGTAIAAALAAQSRCHSQPRHADVAVDDDRALRLLARAGWHAQARAATTVRVTT